MMATATHNAHGTTPERGLFLAFALRETTWTLGVTTGPGHPPRERPVAARHPARWLQAIAQAKRRCGLPEPAPVVRCSDAGRAGFWLHRFFQAPRITIHVVDASSLAGKRRQRRAKSDALDVRQLLRMLSRYAPGARDVWRVVPVPAVAAEDQRQLHRDWETFKQERASTTTRITGWRSRQGVRLTRLRQCPEPLEAVRRWAGSPLPRGRRRRMLRVSAHQALLRQQMAAWEAERRA